MFMCKVPSVMAMDNQIKRFFASPSFGVVGASRDREKYGNKVLRAYLKHGLTAYPIHPKEKEIEGLPSLASVVDLPPETKSISIITPPAVTDHVVEDAIKKGIQNIWMQPGAESPIAIEMCTKHGVSVIADGSCVMVVLAQREEVILAQRGRA